VIRRIVRGLAPPERRDDGAYAILYAILVVVLFSFTAMVVDLAAVREDRRADRVLSDNASLVGADSLSLIGGIKPRTACQNVILYLGSQWGVSNPSTASCSVFPATYSSNCPANSTKDTVTLAGHTVAIAWPVPNASGYMTNPDIKPASITQPGDSTFDGPDPCQRLAVQIGVNQQFSFAGVFGLTGEKLSDASVARNVEKPGNAQEVAALNILNPHICDAVTTSGQGEILVAKVHDPATNTDSPGIIAVESDGHPNGNANGLCAKVGNSPTYVIDPNKNAASWICASGTSGSTIHSATPSGALLPVTCNGSGQILSHALDSGGNANQAYDLARVTANLAPKPTTEGGALGVTPVTDEFGCALSSPCNATTTPIGGLVSKYGKSAYAANGAPALPYTGIDNTFNNSAFKTLVDGAAIPGGLGTFKCTGNGANFWVPAGNWYVDCPDKQGSAGFQAAGSAIFGGGTIVFAGSIQDSGGHLAFNVPLNALYTANSITSTGTGTSITTTPGPTKDALVYVRGLSSKGSSAAAGSLSTSGSYSFWAPRTFFYLDTHGPGFMSVAANGQTFLMTDPQTPDCASTDTACQDRGFHKLALWSECSCTSNGIRQNMGGQGSTRLLGVFFTPYSWFDFSGQANYASAAAQVWSDTLTMSGLGAVILQPDPNNAVKRPVASSTLIR
jgi:hypothetical protein